MYSHKKINPMPGQEGRAPVCRLSNVCLVVSRYGIVVTGLEKIQKYMYHGCDDRNLVTDFGGILCVLKTRAHTIVCLFKKFKSQTMNI